MSTELEFAKAAMCVLLERVELDLGSKGVDISESDELVLARVAQLSHAMARAMIEAGSGVLPTPAAKKEADEEQTPAGRRRAMRLRRLQRGSLQW